MNIDQFNNSNVPPEIVGLIKLAKKWNIGDDFEREQKIRSTTKLELLELATCLDNIDTDILFNWLSGPESFSENPSEEYIAFSILTMAVDLAKLLVARQNKEVGDSVK